MKRKIIPYNPNLVELAKQLRKNMTFAEVLLWEELKKGKMHGLDFNRQRPIDNYIVDFYCKDLGLAIEVDGYTHNTEATFLKDELREKKLSELGISFLRFSDEDVKKDMNNVLREIEHWIINKKKS